MIRILVLVIVLGLSAWLLTFLPIPEPFRTIIFVVMVLALLWEILALAGYVPSVFPKGPPLRAAGGPAGLAHRDGRVQ